MSKKVLFIERNLRNEKLGIMYLSGSLKAHGHHADLVQTDKTDLDQFIAQYKPDFVAFSITTGEHINALKVARYVKQKHGIPNIFGGPHCTFFPEIGYEEGVDFVVQGQAERVIIDIVEGKIERGFIKAELADHLDDIPIADREIFYQYPEFANNPMKNVITSRACPYKCSYCFNHAQFALTKIDGETKKWFDRRSIENVIKEIDQIRSKYPLDKVLFIDDNFIQSQEWLHEFLDGWKEKVKLPWLCSLRVNSLSEELGIKMFESGLEMINYAMESADPDVQQRLLHRGHITNKDILNAIALMGRYGVRARMQNIIGLPLQNSLEDALNTLQFNKRHRVTDSWCSIFQPYPRTALGQYCIDHQYTTEDNLKHCSESFFDESRINIPHKDEIYALQKIWYFAVDFDIPLDLVQIVIRGKFTKEIGDQVQKLRFQYSRKKLYGIKEANAAKDIGIQSRERWSGMNQEVNISKNNTLQIVYEAFSKTDAPSELVDIIAQVEFAQKEIEDFKKFVSGEQVYPTPIYTINDETGDLKDPNVSIFMRGTPNADDRDIRKMPDAHFMKDMLKVREDLIKNVTDLPQNNQAIKSEKDSLEAPTVTGKDERHLNQYLA
ncbi:MAG: B12-binding domain-containing radical SAM protein [Deltaproteobacteria bacterium]|nr:MAG: B12-binding domain-containing radical SAM protein [Deltaproteobacteria bacterium]